MSTYTVTLTTAQAVAVEIALEGAIDRQKLQRKEIEASVAYFTERGDETGTQLAKLSVESISAAIRTNETALQLVKRAPMNSEALSAMLADDNVTRAQAQGVGSALRQNAGE